jgi:hypothetical protein
MADDDTEEKRGRGRPMGGAVDGAGGFVRKNLSLDEASVATAARIHSNASAAVRIALAFWAEHHPPAKKAQPKK